MSTRRFIVFDERVTHEPLDRLRIAVVHTRALTSGRSATGLSHDDADEEVGTIATDSACGFDPFPLLWALHEAGTQAVVIGQVAGIMHGSVELTGDLDLLWDGDPSKADALIQAFGAVGCRLLDDEREPVALGPCAFTLPKVQFESSSVSGDCCTSTPQWGSLPVRDAPSGGTREGPAPQRGTRATIRTSIGACVMRGPMVFVKSGGVVVVG